MSLTGFSQGENISLPVNAQCMGAMRLCSYTFQDTTFNQSYTYDTSTGLLYSTTLFYVFQAGTGTNVTNYLTLSTPDNKHIYSLHGPFSSESSVCDEYVAMPDSIMDSVMTTQNFSPLNTDLNPGDWYLLTVTLFYNQYNTDSGELIINAEPNTMACEDEESEIVCEDCIEAFQPSNGQFILSAWVKEDISSGSAVTTYANTKIRVTGGAGAEDFFPSGQIIDGWQRIEGEFTASTTGAISVELVCSDGEAYFDDIRIFPFDGSMMSYVYDPITRRLMAELDERNYAKLYEYDEEGKLVRVKKETEKGIMTINESRDNNSKE